MSKPCLTEVSAEWSQRGYRVLDHVADLKMRETAALPPAALS
jgi:hypothetical protein